MTSIWSLVESGKDYNRKMDLYDRNRVHERFFRGNQWFGIDTHGHPAFVMNICKRVGDYKIASLMSTRTKMVFTPMVATTDTNDPQSVEMNRVCEIISKHTETKWEKLKMDMLIREGLYDGFNTGDVCAYTYWDDTVDIKQFYGKEVYQPEPTMDEMGNMIQQPPIEQQIPIMGDFCTELVDGENVLFGNPNNRKVKGQPYIIILGRALVSDLREEAKKNGMSAMECEQITSDLDNDDTAGDFGRLEIENGGEETGKCNYAIKFWKDKKTKTIWMQKSIRSCEITKKKDMKIREYPIAWMNWSIVKNCYHGQAEMFGLIPNQIEINRMLSNIAQHLKMTAWGKVIYDRTKIASWSNRVGSAIGADGDVNGIVQQLQPGQLNNAVFTFVDKVIEYTLQFLGATDTALGNVNPDNYKALVANQQQAAVPLENIRANFYQFVEDIGLNWLEFMLIKYNVPRQLYYKQDKEVMSQEFDGSQYKDAGFNIKIDVGPSSWWSELASTQTLDKLLQAQIITPIQFLERLPNGYIMNKEGLIKEIQQQMEQQMQQMQAQQQAMQGQEQQMQQQESAESEMEFEQMSKWLEQQPLEAKLTVLSLPQNQQYEAIQTLMKKSIKV
jgi:hypothetical protein